MLDFWIFLPIAIPFAVFMIDVWLGAATLLAGVLLAGVVHQVLVPIVPNPAVWPRQEICAVPSGHLSSRPESVRWAVYLAVAGFAVSLVNIYRLGPPVSPVLSQMNAGPLWAAFTIIGSVFWLFILFLVSRGLNCARIILCVVAILGIPGPLLVIAFRLADPACRLLSGSQAVLYVAVAVLLLMPTSAGWYRETQRARREGERSG